jgi:hypothetical protein
MWFGLKRCEMLRGVKLWREKLFESGEMYNRGGDRRAGRWVVRMRHGLYWFSTH